MTVPSGAIVRTGYVSVDDVTLACRDRMDIYAVEKAMQRRMSCAPNHPWPCPVGVWHGERYHLHDGRHDFIAALCLGCTHILVAWVEAR
jgi:hypothetical protein